VQALLPEGFPFHQFNSNIIISSDPQSRYVYDMADISFMDALGDDGASEMPVSIALVFVAGIDN